MDITLHIYTQQANIIFKEILSGNKKYIKITVSKNQRQSMHHEQDIPMMINKYFLKMLHAVASYGTIRAAKAILPQNKRSSTKLTRCNHAHHLREQM